MIKKLHNVRPGDSYIFHNRRKIVTEVLDNSSKSFVTQLEIGRQQNRSSVYTVNDNINKYSEFTTKSWAVEITPDINTKLLKDIAIWRGVSFKLEYLRGKLVGIANNTDGTLSKGHNPIHDSVNEQYFDAIYTPDEFYRLSGTKPSAPPKPSVPVFDIKNWDFSEVNYFVYNTKTEKARLIKYYHERQNDIICHGAAYNAEGLNTGRLLIYRFPTNLEGFEFKNSNGRTKVLYIVKPSQVGYGDRHTQEKWYEYRPMGDFLQKIYSGFYTSEVIKPINNYNNESYEQINGPVERERRRETKGEAITIAPKKGSISGGLRPSGNRLKNPRVRGKIRTAPLQGRLLSKGTF